MTDALGELRRRLTVVLTAWAVLVQLLSAGLVVSVADAPDRPGPILCLTNHVNPTSPGSTAHGPVCGLLCLAGALLPAGGPDPLLAVAPVRAALPVVYGIDAEGASFRPGRSPASARAPPVTV